MPLRWDLVGNATFALGSVTLASVPGNRAKLGGYIWVKSTANGVTISDLDVDGTTSSSSRTSLFKATT